MWYQKTWQQINTYINKNHKRALCKTQRDTKQQAILMCVYVYVHVYIRCMQCMCSCVWASEDRLGCCFSDSVHLDFLRQGLSLAWNWLSSLNWLCSKPQGSACLSFYSDEITDMHHKAQMFLIWALVGWTQALDLARESLYWRSSCLLPLFSNLNWRLMGSGL